MLLPVACPSTSSFWCARKPKHLNEFPSVGVGIFGSLTIPLRILASWVASELILDQSNSWFNKKKGGSYCSSLCVKPLSPVRYSLSCTKHNWHWLTNITGCIFFVKTEVCVCVLLKFCLSAAILASGKAIVNHSTVDEKQRRDRVVFFAPPEPDEFCKVLQLVFGQPV